MSDAPGPISPTSTQTISGLYTETFRPVGPAKGVVLITHGYAEHCGRYREVAHVITTVGWAVLTYDVRGHGHSPGARGYIDRFEIYLDDLVAMHAAAQALAPGAPLVLLGHSHGSLITLRALAGDHPPRAAAAIISSPFLALRLAVPGYQRVLAKVASAIAPKLSQPNGIRSEDLTTDPGKQAEHRADTQCFGVATARWFTEAAAAQAYVYEHAGRIRLPTTWLVGADDPITDPARSKAVAAKIAGADYRDLAGMKHEVLNEVERGRVFRDLAGVLSAIAAPPASVSGN